MTYRFATEDHRRLFTSNAAKYVSQHGGFCANGMVYAIPLGGEPGIFKIIDGRLFVFGGVRSRLYFEMDQERNIQLADQYWENEVRDSDWRWQTLKRVWLRKVPHYRSEQQLAEEYARRAR